MSGRRKKSTVNPVVLALFAFLSAFTGLVAGGGLKAIGFSSVNEDTAVIIPLDGQEYNVYGVRITSDVAKHTFYVNGEPIYNGEQKNGVWLARQSGDNGLFFVAGARAFSTVSSVADLTPPEKVWISKDAPKTNDAFYAHARGVWDTGEKYASLGMLLYDSSGTLVDRESTVARLRYEGETYDTSRYGIKGNKDQITSTDTIYQEFKLSDLAAGTYKLVFYEFYNGIGKSPTKSYTFTVEEAETKDTTPPEVDYFTATPVVITEPNTQIAFDTSFRDPDSGIKKSYMRYRGKVTTHVVHIDSDETEWVNSKWFRCGDTTVKLYVVNGQGLTTIKKVTITKKTPDCETETPPSPPPDEGNTDNVTQPGQDDTGTGDNNDAGDTGGDTGDVSDGGDVEPQPDDGLNRTAAPVDWTRAALVGLGVFFILSGVYLRGRAE